jgi:hypothetical protein
MVLWTVLAGVEFSIHWLPQMVLLRWVVVSAD